MPVEHAGTRADGAGDEVVSGRVIANPAPDTILLDDGTRGLQIRGPVGHLLPGDLVRIQAAAERDPRDPAGALYRARHVELTYRPTRAPFGPHTETGAMMGEGLRSRLHLRAAVLEKIRAYFRGQQFLEVETPAIAVSPGLDLHLHAFGVSKPARGQPGSASDLFGYLITSPEYHMKRLLVGGVRRCFQLARCFRAEELGARHEPEFTMLEWYRAWDGLEAMLEDTEQVVRAAASVGATPGRFRVGDGEVELEAPFERLTVREAFARYAPGEGDPIALAERDEDRFFTVLVEQIEPQLGRARPTFLMRYPARQASLARIAADDPTVAERFELYVHGVELCNGFLELTDPVEQRQRLERDQRERAARGLPVYPIDERFLHALEEGMPPSVGNALGVDRLVAMVAGRSGVADVVAFSHARR